MSLVSVIMPVRNAEKFILAALRSVLDQQGINLELIVVDDGSTDESAQVARSLNDPRVRIVAGPQSGIAAAFNAGLAVARGELLARCDADDFFPPHRLGWQIEYLAKHPDFGAVCGYYSTVDQRGRVVAERNGDFVAQEVTEELRSGVGRSHMCAYLFRTDTLRKIGGCRTWFVTAEDRDLQFRLAEDTRVWYEPKAAYIYRLHDASITHSQNIARKCFYDDAARKFQEQRLRGEPDDLDAGRPPAPPSEEDPAVLSSAEEIQNILMGRAWRSHAAGNKSVAVGEGWKACLARPGAFSAWKSFVLLLVKPAPLAAERSGR